MQELARGLHDPTSYPLQHLIGAQLEVGLAEDHEEVAGAGALEELLVGGVHGEVGVHAGDEDLTAQVRDGDPL